ncbi:hypothetical protein [Peribacillus huizhouensis]|uniref:Uncharacterized protein n=1 Tax=Peribacillus huizhouensis TaxID=1501239 RepID=A0ABR6CMR1_9BACI|nr:hypothetical protein [Peribacillus huizhouensis]MBA9026324.1 hypothetical protein [Peribacillus huizhouensis]
MDQMEIISALFLIIPVPQVWEVNPGEGWPFQVSFAQKGITFFSYVPGTLDRIIGMDHDGDERVQLYLLKNPGELIVPRRLPIIVLI